jgi:hypothetical protein
METLWRERVVDWSDNEGDEEKQGHYIGLPQVPVLPIILDEGKERHPIIPCGDSQLGEELIYMGFVHRTRPPKKCHV